MHPLIDELSREVATKRQRFGLATVAQELDTGRYIYAGRSITWWAPKDEPDTLYFGAYLTHAEEPTNYKAGDMARRANKSPVRATLLELAS